MRPDGQRCVCSYLRYGIWWYKVKAATVCALGSFFADVLAEKGLVEL